MVTSTKEEDVERERAKREATPHRVKAGFLVDGSQKPLREGHGARVQVAKVYVHLFFVGGGEGVGF
jgi:hypothetical protein